MMTSQVSEPPYFFEISTRAFFHISTKNGGAYRKHWLVLHTDVSVWHVYKIWNISSSSRSFSSMVYRSSHFRGVLYLYYLRNWGRQEGRRVLIWDGRLFDIMARGRALIRGSVCDKKKRSASYFGYRLARMQSFVKGTLRDGKELCNMADKHCLWGCAVIFSLLKDSSVN